MKKQLNQRLLINATFVSKLQLIFVSIVLCTLLTGVANATSNLNTVNFQGFLTLSDGEPVTDGTYTMTVSLWDGPSNTTDTKVWEENHIVTVSRGIYSISLGDFVAFPNTLSFATQYYLGVSVDDNAIDQLIPLTNTWTAFRAKTAGGRCIREISSNYSITNNDDIIIASGNVRLTLPPTSDVPNRIFTIKKMDSSNMISIETNGSETIDGVNRGSGGTPLEISNQYDEVSVISDGQKWISMGIMFGVLSHEKGGLEADVSDFEGLVKISGGTTSALTITGAGESILDDSDVAAQRATLGLTPGEGLETDSGNLRISSSAAGNGLTGGGGSALSVNVDDSTLEINTNIVQIKDNGITDAKINGVSASKISGTLFHEKGGLEADISNYEGLIKISGGTTSALSITGAGEALLDDTDAAAQRSTLALGSISTQDSTSVNIDGGSIDNTSIGASTPLSATFTDLIATGTTNIESAAITLGKNNSNTTGRIIFHDNQNGDNFTTTIQSAADVNTVVTFTLPSTTGTADQLLKTDGAGILSWADPSSATSNMIAGNGLTGGGDITADRTFNVVGGDGITANADEIAVNAGTGLEINADNLRIASSAAGDGLGGGAGSPLSVNAGTGLEINADNLRIASSAAGDGLVGGAGSSLNVQVDNSTIEISGDSLKVKDNSISDTQVSTITTSKISGLGGMASQNESNVSISGGSIDGTTIGEYTPDEGTFTNLIAGYSLVYAKADQKKVGILNESPQSELDVSGDIGLTGNLKLQGGSYIYFGDSGTDGTWRIYINNDHFVFQRKNNSVWEDKFEITD
ncbi:MAG: hypothetical protein OMM_01392 [Candidatus Magnetoglobus multicellularis str. Araruama]|uniref:Uncharacterized protein n=1 Tax=Candidatus Magnetoglobus multicellularis str. Araruama TaxID=890399 RepID=A0A1V1PDI2_9BACT|nr:MAG: hypothetical protein OMM_01392 [Candidatus Magnetoglobus multicellularis str. Araruama]